MKRSAPLLVLVAAAIVKTTSCAHGQPLAGPSSLITPYFRSIVETALRRRGVDFAIDGSTVRIKMKVGPVILPLAEVQEYCTKHPEEDCLALVQAFFSGALNEKQNIIGPLGKLLQYKDQLDPYDPRLPLLKYHELREVEVQKWQQNSVGRKAFPISLRAKQEIDALLASPMTYTASEMKDFVDISPSLADASIESLALRYRSANADERSYIRARVDPDRGWTLLTFAKRAAVRARRTNDAKIIHNGLTALAIEDLAQGDVRDDLVTIGLLYHIASSLKAETTTLFKQVADISSPAIATLLTDFLQRDDLDRVDASMGWREVSGPQGIGYVWDMEP
jgi:hypothetical protein